MNRALLGISALTIVAGLAWAFLTAGGAPDPPSRGTDSASAILDVDSTLFGNFGYDGDQFLNEAGATRLPDDEEGDLDPARKLPSWADRIVPPSPSPTV